MRSDTGANPFATRSSRGLCTRDVLDARIRCRAVLLLDRRPDLLAEHRDLAGGVDPDPNGRSGDVEHRDGDVVADADRLTGLARDDEHRIASYAVAATGPPGLVGCTCASSTSSKMGCRRR